MNRINIITLGVANVKASLQFYRDGLGFVTPYTEENPDIVFFDNGGTKLALYPFDQLAADIDSENPTSMNHGFNGITLAYNAKTKAEVDDIFSRIEEIGGTIVKAPELVFWGGYSGYFKDLDGYYWEVAYADSWKFNDDDMLIIEE